LGVVYPNYNTAIGHRGIQADERHAKRWLEFIEVTVPLGKIDPGPVVQAMLDAQPDAIFSSLFGPDLAASCEGELRGLFKNRPVFSLLGGGRNTSIR
jgi:branched-chain amino acid transport system substrate-binding protein